MAWQTVNETDFNTYVSDNSLTNTSTSQGTTYYSNSDNPAKYLAKKDESNYYTWYWES